MKKDNKKKFIHLFESLNGVTVNDANIVGQPRQTIFDITNVQQLTDLLNNGLEVPVKKAGFSTLGGKENVSVMILVAFDPKEKWPHGILENSHYARFHIDRDGTIEMFSSGGVKNRFRKTRAKSMEDILNKINSWIKIEGVQLTNERTGYTAEPQNQNPFANTQLANTMPVGDNQPTSDNNTATDDFDPTAPVFAPVIPEGEVTNQLTKSVTKREVRHLRVGDVLSGTGGKVVSAPTSGLKTPPGKIEVVIEYPNGRKIGKIWGKYTVVGIRPAVEQQPALEEMAQYKPQTYFNTQQQALEDAFEMARSKGFEVVLPDNLWTEHVGYGQTVKYDLELTKGGFPVKNRLLHIVLYRMDSGKYELITYVG
jgi:hypothetical protein